MSRSLTAMSLGETYCSSITLRSLSCLPNLWKICHQRVVEEISDGAPSYRIVDIPSLLDLRLVSMQGVPSEMFTSDRQIVSERLDE